MCQANSSDAEASDRSEGAALQSGDGAEAKKYIVNTAFVRGLADILSGGFCKAGSGCNVTTCACGIAEDGAEAILGLLKENNRLRAALKPFADIPPSSSDPAHYWVVNGSPSQSHFTRQDLARARKALESSIEERSDTEVPAAECSPDTSIPNQTTIDAMSETGHAKFATVEALMEDLEKDA